MPNPNEGGNLRGSQFSIERYIKELEQKFKAPLTSQMREAANVTMTLTNQHLREYQENEESLLVLDRVLRTHPEDLSFIAEKEDTFRRVNLGVTCLVKKRKSDDLCQRLITATGPTGNVTTRIDLNDEAFMADPFLSSIFRGLKYALSMEEGLNPYNDIVNIGKRDAVEEFLDALAQPEKPLIPYQRNIGERVISLVPTYDNKTLSGTLSTKVSGVYVQYVYPNFQSVPIMSIQITRIP